MFRLPFNDGMSHTYLCTPVFEPQLNALFWKVVGFPGHRAWLAEAGHRSMLLKVRFTYHCHPLTRCLVYYVKMI